MGYDGKVMHLAQLRYDNDKTERTARFAQKEEAIIAKIPRIGEIDRELRGTMSRIISSALRRGTDPASAIRVLRDENLSLQAEKRQLLEEHGYPPDYLVEKPNCLLCGDTGYRGNEVCRCLRAYYVREQKQELSHLLDIGGQTFETFRLDCYSEQVSSSQGISPRENAEGVFRICKNYAENFGVRSGNLLLTGAPGLGKTFLSTCIAGEVSENGFSVYYDTAGCIFSRFEAQKFGRDEGGADADVARVLNCDLLIMDDLGTEMTTSFVQSALYQILNTRLMTEKKTILNTNLTAREIGQRYSPQIRSRLEGEYRELFLFGDDIRQQKG